MAPQGDCRISSAPNEILQGVPARRGSAWEQGTRVDCAQRGHTLAAGM